ncbi:MAG: hypothetical protein L0Z62_50825 [Gemmataceae bacterium]|nr:hypothetical protein [Gemmataceae bacterium]
MVSKREQGKLPDLFLPKGATVMQVRTHSLILDAPQAEAFAFLADVHNLPRWATEFCQELEFENGRTWVTSPGGRLLFQIEADERTGVIDLRAGPSENLLTTWPTRVCRLPDGRSVFLFTAIQPPGMSNAEFDGQCQGLEREFLNITRLLG